MLNKQLRKRSFTIEKEKSEMRLEYKILLRDPLLLSDLAPK